MNNTSVTYSLYLNSNVKQNLAQTETAALSLDKTMSNLSKTVHHLGFGFIAANAFGFLKSGIEDAAKYQDAINRIKFASENLKEGFKNMAFIRQEAIDLKIPLQQTTDAYGKFLAMVQGSGMASQKVRELHDNLLVIGKIKHLDPSLMDAGVLNLGKMLEAGGLDARHLRPLEQQLSGIGSFLAREIGTNIQGLRKMIHAGEAATIDPQLLVNAIKKQAESLRHHLPEALDSLQSHIDDTKNSWLEFKNNLVLDYRDEIIDFFKSLRDLIKYISDNKDGLKKFGEAIVFIGKAYLLYKVSLTAVNTVKGIYQALEKTSLGNVSSVVSSNSAKAKSYDAQAVSVSNLAKEIQALNFVTNASSSSFITSPSGVTMINNAGNRYKSYQQSQSFRNNMANARGLQALAYSNANSILSNGNQSLRNSISGSYASRFGNIASSASGVFAGALPVVVTMLTVAAAMSIADAVSKGGSFKNAQPNERIDLAKAAVLENIRDLNKALHFKTGWSDEDVITGHLSKYFDKTPETLAELKKFNPDVIHDREFVDKVMYALEQKGNRTFIDLAHKLGFWASSELSNGPYEAMIKAIGGGKSPFQDALFLANHSSNPESGGFTDPLTRNILRSAKLMSGDIFDGSFKDPSSSEHHKIGKSSSVRGNSVTTINIDIGEMIGLKNPTFSVKSSSDMKDIEKTIGDVVVKMLTQAVNDSQLIGKSH